VIDTSVLRSIPMLDDAAQHAVMQWRFEPALLNGEPIEVEMVVTINFTLSKSRRSAGGSEKDPPYEAGCEAG
jgi:hypothetical protein